METKLLELLNKEVRPAIGCTEPVAVAYGAAIMRETIGEPLVRIKVVVNANLFKNGMGVYVPGTKKTGLYYSVAMGVLFGDVEKELEVLSSLPADGEKRASEFLKKVPVEITYLSDERQVYVDVIGESHNDWAKISIRGSHGNVVLKERNGVIQYMSGEIKKEPELHDFYKQELSIQHLMEIVEGYSYEELSFLEESVAANMEIASYGRENKLGLGVGFNIKGLVDQGIFSDDLINKCKSYTAGASDARMNGESLRVYSCGGSGNQGLAASIPVILVGEALGIKRIRILRGLALSYLVTLFVKKKIGRLSALCGCGVAAGVGTAVAIGKFYGMQADCIESGVANIMGNITGMVCDGAKPGCALKLSTSVGTVIEMMLLADKGTKIHPGEGIIGKTLMDTLNNLEKLSIEGMGEADATILAIMLNQAG